MLGAVCVPHGSTHTIPSVGSLPGNGALARSLSGLTEDGEEPGASLHQWLAPEAPSS